jgi:hypothetical protein
LASLILRQFAAQDKPAAFKTRFPFSLFGDVCKKSS